MSADYDCEEGGEDAIEISAGGGRRRTRLLHHDHDAVALECQREGGVRPAESRGQDPRGGRGAPNTNGRAAPRHARQTTNDCDEKEEGRAPDADDGHVGGGGGRRRAKTTEGKLRLP